MSVVDTTPKSQTDSLSFELDLHHAPEKVWRAITDPVLLTEWLLPSVGFKPEAGASFVLRAPEMPGWDGLVNCRVLEVEAHRKLSYTWAVGGMELDTVVTFTLTPTPRGTKLSLVQSGFGADQAKNWGGARYGWKMMGGKLVDVLSRISEAS